MRLEFPAPFPDLCRTLHCLSTCHVSLCCELGLPACLHVCSVCCCWEDTCCSRAFLPLFLVLCRTSCSI